MCEFEQKVFDGLSRCCGTADFSSLKIGIAVSGGADSVSLLVALSHFCKNLEVISINHNIREVNETLGDALFVRDLSASLAIPCTIVEIPRGKVSETARLRGQGIEEAARFLRYNAFESFIDDKNLDFLCLAHNQNDQLETILMRFLNGSSLEASCGVSFKRGKFIRPLLWIKRVEIESYLNDLKIGWRTDSTNLDSSYLRNKIRLQLFPFLNENFTGWQSAVLSGAKKMEADAKVIADFVDGVKMDVVRNASHGVEDTSQGVEDASHGVEDTSQGVEVSLSLNDFNKLPSAIKTRVLLKACSKVSEESRIPSVFLEDFCKNPREVYYKSIQILVKNSKIFVKKAVKTHTETVFSDIIEGEGVYNFPFGIVSVFNEKSFENSMLKKSDLLFNDDFVLHGVELPCCIRSIGCDDEIECADKSMKKICDVFSDWHIPAEQKSLIPIVQKLSGKNQEIICIAGSVLGFKNWIVGRLVDDI